MTDPTANLDEFLGTLATKAEVAAVAKRQDALDARLGKLEAGTPTTPTTPTDPLPTGGFGTFERPFAANSPWNVTAPAAGSTSDARTVQMRAGLPTGNDGTGVNLWQYTMPNYQAKASDPLVTVVDTKHSNYSLQLRIPADAKPDPGTDGSLTVLQPDGTLVDMWVARWISSTRIECDRIGRTPVTGSGCGPAKKDPTNPVNWEWIPAGCRAFGGSFVGGLISTSEVGGTDPAKWVIPHALALALPGKWLRFTGYLYQPGSGEHIYGQRGETSGPLGYGNYLGYVPPATEQDYHSAWGGYSTNAGIPMGTRFVLPKSVSIDSLGLSPSVKVMAKAAQDYGVLVVDCTGIDPAWAMFYGDPRLKDSAFAKNLSSASLTKLRQSLVVAA